MLWGCADEASRSGSPTVRDSAGVRIAEHTVPDSLESLIVASIPAVDLGGRDTPGGGLFRVASVSRLGDGSIVVSHGGREFRSYAADLPYLEAAGGGDEERAEVAGRQLEPVRSYTRGFLDAYLRHGPDSTPKLSAQPGVRIEVLQR